ncbi:MAG: DUF2723 domain-containing protein [Flavobacteriales bacterium]|nr:DUF2723 domain-containing protein [Flavobacteriales bacterium]
MINYKFWNNLIGWASFAIALVVYSLTVESNVPLWDCGEFISAAYTLQVVHPPGAPLFLMLGRLFSLFSFGDAHNVAFMVNMMSVVASALTVAITFWITTHFALKILGISVEKPEVSTDNAIIVFGSGMIAALALTFMDSFWFSAVEAEVYAASSLFTALSFWGILKWESNRLKPKSNQWIVFIAYTIGLAIGIHLLNLLVIPAVVLYYFLIEYDTTSTNILKAAAIGMGALAVTNWIIIPGLPWLNGRFDLLFVNSFGLPYHTGEFFSLALVIWGIVWAIRYSIRKNMPLLNLGLLCITFILIGFSSYTMIPVRATAEPAINMNAPKNPITLTSYIKREQYGDRPLFNGPYYYATSADLIDVNKGAATYRMGDDKYERTGNRYDYEWSPEVTTMLPRMGDQSEKKQGYKYWYDEVVNSSGKVEKPPMRKNLGFMFKYQIGHMYWRYFWWNFAGRQSNQQNVDKNILEGNWLSGVNFIDEMRLGNQRDLPPSMTNNKARNKYYFIPFLLGVIGIFVQFKKQKKDAWVVTALFIFTGIMIVIYLNQPPLEPRERDYTNVGSYQTFCIWIGLGVLGIADFLRRKVKLNLRLAGVLAFVLAFSGPYLMGQQNWDDHDRSGREMALSFAKNYLNSCEENAILFTAGDNDTYPLWYAQNVEGFRTDVRVINLALLSAEYYAQALTKQYYGSAPLPMSVIPKDKLMDGTRDRLDYVDMGKKFNPNEGYNLYDVIQFMTSDDPQAQVGLRDGSRSNYIPVKKVVIPVDKAAVLSSKTLSEKDSTIVEFLQFEMQDHIYKGSLIMLDIIATNAKEGWKRPIYFSSPRESDTYVNMSPYLRTDGLVYRLVPRTPTREEYLNQMMVNENELYDKLMNKYVWGGLEKGKTFLDDKSSTVPYMTRNLFGNLASYFVEKGDNKKAIDLILKSLEVYPESILPLDIDERRHYADILRRAGETETSKKLMEQCITQMQGEVKYYNILKKDQRNKSLAVQMLTNDNPRMPGMKKYAENCRITAQKAFGDSTMVNQIRAIESLIN